MLAALAMAGCRSEPAPKAEPAVVKWKPLGAWSGHGNAQTESFDAETGELRVIWQTSHEQHPGTGIFAVTLHSAVSGRVLEPVVDYRGVGHDTAYVTVDPHLSYLVIDSSNIDWSVKVEEGIVTGGEK